MNTIWDYTLEELTGLVRDHVDAVLAADAETNEYRAFVRKGIFEKLIGEQGKNRGKKSRRTIMYSCRPMGNSPEKSASGSG